MAQASVFLICCVVVLVTSSKTFKKDDLGAEDHRVLYCSFDDDCGFQYYHGNRDFFGLRRTPLSSDGAGPDVDHTRGIVGGYVFGMDASRVGKGHSMKAIRSFSAKSPVFPGTSLPYCFKFWYLMKGSEVQDLEVNVDINGGTGYPVLKFNGPQSQHWKLASIDIDSEYTSQDFQIEFTMTLSNNKYHRNASIVIDDFLAYNTSCQAIPRSAPNTYQKTINGSKSYYTFHTEARTWKDAYDVCRRTNPWTALVSIQTTVEQQFLVDIIKKDTTLSLVGQMGFYTSGSDITKERKFVWTDKDEPEVVPSNLWHAGQPNNVGGIQDCLLMQYAADNYRWGDVNCETKHPFICETQG